VRNGRVEHPGACPCMGTASITPANWRARCASSAVGSSYVGSGMAVLGFKMGESDAPEDEKEDVMLSLRCCGWSWVKSAVGGIGFGANVEGNWVDRSSSEREYES
jgi:hypothetical protein